MGLQDQAIRGVFWNSIGTISTYLVEFVVGILLARILTPSEFGIIGTVMIVINISQVFINSGFSQALLRKQNCSNDDYSTAFYFNILTGFILSILIFIVANPIGRFFNNENIEPYIKALSLTLIIGSFSLVHQTIVQKRIDFKLQSRISIIASFFSGLTAVLLALNGFGIWSLVVKTLFNQFLITILLWILNAWRPRMIFNFDSFREMFRFGSNLLISGFLGAIFNNIYYALIGKFFTPQDLGYYTRAELFKNLPSQNAEKIISSVGYPILAAVQDDQIKLLNGFRQILTKTFFIVSILMFGLASISRPLINVLIGEQWSVSAEYLRILCFVGLLYPLNSLNINVLNVLGRSDLYLKAQLLSQLLTLPVLLIGYLFGIKLMIVGICMVSLFSYILFSKISSKFINYDFHQQIKDIAPGLLVSIAMGLVLFIIDVMIKIDPIYTLLIQFIVGGFLIIGLSELFALRDYFFIKNLIINKIKYIIHKKE